MRIYNYDVKTGEYLGDSDAYPSPLEKGKFLVPAFATEIAPPLIGEHQAPVFSPETQTWGLVPDYRGVVRYATSDGHEVKIEEVNVTPESLENCTDIPRPSEFHVWKNNAWTLDVEAQRAAAINRFNALVTERLNSFAREREYNDIDAAVNRITSSNVDFAKEGRCAGAAYDQTWGIAIAIYSSITSGARPIPTDAVFLSELPALSWEMVP